MFSTDLAFFAFVENWFNTLQILVWIAMIRSFSRFVPQIILNKNN